MSELKSKCCRAETYLAQYITEESKKTTNYYEKLGNICSKCNQSTEVEEVNKPQNTALYASLRR